MTECSEHPEKECSKCKANKFLSEFPKSSRYASGLNPQCKSCLNATSKSWRDNNPDKFKASRKKNYQINIEKMREEKRREYMVRRLNLKKLYMISNIEKPIRRK